MGDAPRVSPGEAAPEVPAARKRVSSLALLLALSPALAVSTRGLNALVVGVAVVLTLVLSTLAVTVIGALARRQIHLVAHIAVVAVLVTALDAALRALAPALHAELGIYFPLACAGTVAVGRAAIGGRCAQEPSARDVGQSTADAGLLGLGAALCLFAIACLREAFGHGTVTLIRIGRFDGTIEIAGLARNPSAVAVRAAGALLLLGFLLGLVKWIAMRRRAP